MRIKPYVISKRVTFVEYHHFGLKKIFFLSAFIYLLIFFFSDQRFALMSHFLVDRFDIYAFETNRVYQNQN